MNNRKLDEQAKPHEAKRVIQTRARINSKSAYKRLEKVARLYSEFYDLMLDQRLTALADSKPIPTSNRQQKEIARLNASNPEMATVFNRVFVSAVLELDSNWKRYIKYKDDEKNPAGIPTHKQDTVRTIACCSLTKANIKFTESGQAVIKIKGLPALRLKDKRIQPGFQFSAVTIKLAGRKVLISLVYKIQLPPKPEPEFAKKAIGVDRNIAATLATSSGIIYQSPNLKAIEEEIRELQRDKRKITGAAINRGEAGYRAILDENNKQLLTAKGRGRRELYWTSGKPSNGYVHNREQVAAARRKKANCQHQFLHRATTAIVTDAKEKGASIIGVENLQIKNLTKSAKGTEEKPGRNVRAKRTLSFRIMEKGWGKAVEMIQYKAEAAGITVTKVSPANTSITCHVCGNKDKHARQGQAYNCARCHSKASSNAETNAGVNIGDKAQAFHQKEHRQKEHREIDENLIRMARRIREDLTGDGTSADGKGRKPPTGAGRTTLIQTKRRPKIRKAKANA